MKIKIKNILSASVLILSVFSVAHAAYPTSYWQIGQVSEVLEFNYGDDSIASNVMAIYPNGSVVVNTFAPSDGTAEGTPEGGQLLELDIGGDIGAEYYCDSEGENCFRPEQIGVGSLHAIFSNDDFNGAYPIDTSGPNYFNPNHGDRIYTNNGTKVYVYDSDDLTWEEGAPIDGDRVFNLHGRIVQTFDGNTSTCTSNVDATDTTNPTPICKSAIACFRSSALGSGYKRRESLTAACIASMASGDGG